MIRRTGGTPVVLVTGVCPHAMAAATIALQWDLPQTVVVRHEIDLEGARLHRTVSDVTGVLERDSLDLEHACVGCAVREDILPTLERLADLGRWQTIVAHLPVAAEALQVCRVLALEDDTGVAIHGVVAALDGPELVTTLTGDPLLAELGRHTSDDDRRGLAETACGLVEYADVVSVHGATPSGGLPLLRVLARPDAVLVDDTDPMPSARMLSGMHEHERTEAWSTECRTGPVHPPVHGVWQLDLRSPKPFHPERLHEQLATIGQGAHRNRGCFWLPSRPGVMAGWDGAGGQVSIGDVGPWGVRRPRTRIGVTGLDALTAPAERQRIRQAFESALMTDDEMDRLSRWGAVDEDGFEPWLGEIRRAA